MLPVRSGGRAVPDRRRLQPREHPSLQPGLPKSSKERKTLEICSDRMADPVSKRARCQGRMAIPSPSNLIWSILITKGKHPALQNMEPTKREIRISKKTMAFAGNFPIWNHPNCHGLPESSLWLAIQTAVPPWLGRRPLGRPGPGTFPSLSVAPGTRSRRAMARPSLNSGLGPDSNQTKRREGKCFILVCYREKNVKMRMRKDKNDKNVAIDYPRNSKYLLGRY